MADIDPVLKVAKLVDEMRRTGIAPSNQDWIRLADEVSVAFDAKREEVAILRVSGDGKMLNFLFPLKLSVIGTLPMTITHSLAIRTIRERHGEIVNNFPAYKHPTVFEAVNLSEQEKALPIQKIMSSPMIVGGKIVGVMQISRKARPGDPVGPDFTAADLAQLTTLGSVIGKYLAELPAPSSTRLRPPANP